MLRCLPKAHLVLHTPPLLRNSTTSLQPVPVAWLTALTTLLSLLSSTAGCPLAPCALTPGALLAWSLASAWSLSGVRVAAYSSERRMVLNSGRSAMSTAVAFSRAKLHTTGCGRTKDFWFAKAKDSTVKMRGLSYACSRGASTLRLRCNAAAAALGLHVVAGPAPGPPMQPPLPMPAGCRCYMKRRIIHRLPRVTPRAAAAAPDFFAEGEVQFEDLGVSATLQQALQRQGLSRPSRVQVRSFLTASHHFAGQLLLAMHLEAAACGSLLLL